MNSIAKNEFEVISFLIRNFFQRFTIRSIAQNLKLSPAGVHSILKKLEKNNIVIHEKLGTGLFYAVNFDSKIARHLASIVLLDGDIKLDIKTDAKAVIATKTDVLVILEDISVFEQISVPDKNIITISESSLMEKIRAKDPKIISIFKQGVVISGEEIVIDLIGEYQK